ncbi:hypothetical protein ACQUW5_14585, partial [Legionella sp. CNM-1927-20]|uniref:hypothetical protein n=1 Tax=Legionella sp. CNM-1927-20 TaxID=3422221 RepID=UPI00403B11EE
AVGNNDLIAADRQALKTVAEQREKFFQLSQAVKTASPADVDALKGAVGRNDNNAILVALQTVANNNRPPITPLNQLTDVLPADLDKLKTLAKTQGQFLEIKEHIDRVDHYEYRLLKALNAIRQVNTPAKIRTALSNNKFVGTGGKNLSINDLPDDKARELQKIIDQKFTKLLFERAINFEVKDKRVLERFFFPPSPPGLNPGLDTNADNNAIRAALQNFCNAVFKRDQSFKVDLTTNNNNLSDLDIQAMKNLVLGQYNDLTRQRVIANFVVQVGSGRFEHFSDKPVPRGGAVPNEALSTVVDNATGPSVHGLNAGPATYKGQKLEDGDKIYSIGNFPIKARQVPAQQPQQPPQTVTEAAQGMLVQDHTGKVTDITKPDQRAKLTDGEKAEMALKQAKMYLISQVKNINSKNIICISKGSPEEAKRLYAALLALKGDLDIEIRVYTPGFQKPKAGRLETQKTAEKKFIEATLGAGLNEQTLKDEKKEVTSFIENTQRRRAQIAKLRKENQHLKADRLEVEEGQNLDQVGRRTPMQH